MSPVSPLVLTVNISSPRHILVYNWWFLCSECLLPTSFI